MPAMSTEDLQNYTQTIDGCMYIVHGNMSTPCLLKPSFWLKVTENLQKQCDHHTLIMTKELPVAAEALRGHTPSPFVLH